MISTKAIQFFETRGIDPETLDRAGVASDTRCPPGDDNPCEVIVFPFREAGQPVNHKYRASGKRFWQDRNAHKTFWNADALDDPALSAGDTASPLIITEGEIDALSVLEVGIPHVVSVPDGAPKQVADGDLDPETDTKFSYVWNNRERLQKIRQFVLATDADEPGQALRDELARRLGKARCRFVQYPDGCKDLNDVLTKHGPEAVTNCITTAKPYPVSGLYTLGDYPNAQPPKCYEPAPGHWHALGKLFRPFLGSLVVVTGVPGHGKSTWVMALCYNLARAHGFTCAMATFENEPVPDVRDSLRTMHMGKLPQYADDAARNHADQFIQSHFVFVGADPRNEEEDRIDLEFLLEKSEEAVVRHNAKVIVIDPWNMIEHRRGRGEEQLEYIERALRAFRRFAKSFGCLVIIVAHPTKDIRQRDGTLRPPNLYDIAGSADWYNKPDFGIVVWRPERSSSAVEVRIQKARFQPRSGREGIATFSFNQSTHTYEEMPDEYLAEVG